VRQLEDDVRVPGHTTRFALFLFHGVLARDWAATRPGL
jgi:hypothetical protein